MNEAETYNLAFDRADMLQACADGDALGLYPLLVAAWERMPVEARRSLRGRFDMRVVHRGRGAHVGVPVASAAVGRPTITLGAAVADAALSFLHELAHIACGHCELSSDYSGPSQVRTWTLAPETLAALVADGVPVVDVPPDAETMRREREAWATVAAWGFDVPAAYLEME